MTTREEYAKDSRRAELEDGLVACPVPDHMYTAIRNYVIHRRGVGRFLTAVLENNLQEATARADEQNLAALRAWCRLLYNFTPGPCWGSPAKVQAWLEGIDQ